MRVRVRFEDPDRLSLHFQTEDYLPGAVIRLVPGPLETNWLLRLDKPLRCRDVHGQQRQASFFLLKPNGLDAEEAMARLPERRPAQDGFAAMAMVVNEERHVPRRIRDAEEYRQYPMVSDVRILTEQPRT